MEGLSDEEKVDGRFEQRGEKGELLYPSTLAMHPCHPHPEEAEEKATEEVFPNIRWWGGVSCTNIFCQIFCEYFVSNIRWWGGVSFCFKR